MTITTRSRRATAFTSGHTPAVVGPGSYAPDNATHPIVQPSYSAFASSNKRDLNKNTGTSAITPGPGAYATDATAGHTSGVACGQSSNVFTTKVPRFAPHAPGSTIYLPSTVNDNPGPGAYSCPSALEPTDKFTAMRPTSHQFSNLIKQGVPTIPRKDQSYGYSTDGDGDLHRHSAPASTYSGLGNDTVGPACYNVRKEPGGDLAATVASLKSTTKRDVWDELSPRLDIPGPGHYNPKGLTSTMDKAEKPSAVFASKVPILPEPRRIQQDDEKALLLALHEQTHVRKSKFRGIKKEQFGSTSGRTDIASNMHTPFVTPTCNETPGPGTYVDKKKNRYAVNRIHQRPTLRDDGVGFQAVSERPCLAKTKTNNPMGPGAYNPTGYGHTLEKKVRQRQGIGRMGQFGSTTERFLWNMTPESMEPEEQTPGPGTYIPAQPPHNRTGPANGRRPRVYTSSAFRSTTERFAKGNNHAPEFHIVGACSAPAVGDYDLVNPPQHKVATNPYLKIPFMSQGQRSEIGQDMKQMEVPGPGQYEVLSPRDLVVGTQSRTRTNAVRSTLGTKPRFDKGPSKPHELLGPGSYAIPTTIGTKSFNVTMKPKT
ncbi:hypothetical protein H310_08922 [Aphanomyces invadans]|uniref:Uncharacterized protein n=1 Tax=Aphanomyces invadans TaxID=157072 RepID=A0A024TX31_9STRA|nr:hypothetical protein H310_08922 [Aphanomyces invadans]ETV98196.1 hypothetical protein H310_08922 [Aphanomyces invadans]|eukprot:XP_008873071.1 hypothetical protein H310_08922 [Aphanomyces invadans]